MQTIWDENKRQSNLHKHKVDFIDAARIFDGDVVTIEDTRFDYGERRYISFGWFGFKPLIVIHSYPDETTIRIISARKANPHERKTFLSDI